MSDVQQDGDRNEGSPSANTLDPESDQGDTGLNEEKTSSDNTQELSTDQPPSRDGGLEDVEDEEGGMQRLDSMMSPYFALKGDPGSNPGFPQVVESANNLSNLSGSGGGGSSFASPLRGEGELDDVPTNEGAPPPALGLINPRMNKYVNLVNDILWTRDFVVPEEQAIQLCDDVHSILHNEPTLLDVRVESAEESVCCVGDIHGQIADIRSSLFRLQGDPKRKFVFLGDYVDRGPCSVEVICLLFALKCEFPEKVFLLRGNHEESTTSRIYGFLFEVRTKYGQINLWTKVNATFCEIPLAALVTVADHRFLCVHGGLSPNLTDLDQLNSIDRQDYGGTLDTGNALIVDGLLWSDPTDNTALYANNERGCGFLFGSAATAEFCTANSIDFVCRAHQIAMEGYCWTHNGRTLTIFSAPNYVGMNNNLAALLLVDYSWNLKFIQYDAATEEYPDFNEKTGEEEGSEGELDDAVPGNYDEDDMAPAQTSSEPDGPAKKPPQQYFSDD